MREPPFSPERFSGVVQVGDEAWTFGYANRAHAVPNTVETRFGIASGVKGFTALVAVGTLPLALRARELLGDDLPLVDDRVTVEHLLRHTSGIGDYLDEDVHSDWDDYLMPVPGPRGHRLPSVISDGLVADGFDVVAVGIEHVAAVVVGVVPPQAGCAVVGSARVERRGVEGVHLRPAPGPQRDVEPALRRLPVRLDEERRPFCAFPAESGRRSGELHQQRHPERSERPLVERLAALVVGNGEPDVIERDHPVPFGAGPRRCSHGGRRDRALACWWAGARLVGSTEPSAPSARYGESAGSNVEDSRKSECVWSDGSRTTIVTCFCQPCGVAGFVAVFITWTA